MHDPNLVRFRQTVQGALAHLESRRQEVNDLNVFPVADGDTGDNMVLTLRAVLAEIDRLADGRTLDEIGREEIVDSVARAALLGARGNSGVILSQLIRGAAEELVSRPGELVDPVLVGAAMARAADRAYQSVSSPVEGTILTVVREMAHRIASELAHMKVPRLNGHADPHFQDKVIADILERALKAGQESVMRSPDLLPILRESGVVDAGGHGLVLVFAGVISALKGDDAPVIEHQSAPIRVTHPQHKSSTFRYCTNFAVTGQELKPDHFRRELEQIGDSVLVVGDHITLKIHVHTDTPEAATKIFEDSGRVSHLAVADMHEQVQERMARLVTNGNGNGQPKNTVCGALAVAHGEGLIQLFEGLGISVLDGGPTLNPSTYDLLAGIHQVQAEAVVLLPNSANVLMAAERAAELSEKEVIVIPTRSLQAGLAVGVNFEPQRELTENATAMNTALAGIKTGAVAPAARDDGQGRFRSGEAIGFVGEELVAWGSPDETLASVLMKLGGDAEIVTCISGDNAPLKLDEISGLSPDGVEVECSEGGQPNYWWLLAAE